MSSRLLCIALSLSAAGLAGCSSPLFGPNAHDAALRRMLTDVQHEAAALPDGEQKEAVVNQLAAMGQVLAGGAPADTERAVAAAEWYDLFGPKACEVSYFTEFADFNGDGARDGMIVFVNLSDRFGDPVKAFGRFRIETFQYISLAIDKRGAQMSNWVVNVFTAQDVERYYDSITRGFRFPLKFAEVPGVDRLIVQVTYYLPDGSGRKMFAERLIKPSE